MKANPIVIKELRSRMRGPRAFVILTVFLLLLGAFSYGLFRIVTFQSGFAGGGAPLGAVVGRTVFIGLAFLELMLVCLITPALTAGAISSEDERKTLDMLLATPLRAASILWGKLISALSYVFLLILAAVPMASIVFLLGGVTFGDMAQVLGVLVLCAITFGTLGLFFSVLLRRTGRATVASYAVLLLLMFGSYFVYVVIGVMRQAEPARAILFANPIAAMAAAAAGEVRSADAFGATFGAFTPLLWALSGAAANAVKAGAGQSEPGLALRTLWHYSAGIYLLTTGVLYLLSVQLLKPIRRWRIGRRGAMALGAALVVLAAGGYAFYGPGSYAQFGYPALPTPTLVPGMVAGVGMAQALSAKAVAVAVPVVVPTAEPVQGGAPLTATVTASPGAARPVATVAVVSSKGFSEEDMGEIYAAAVLKIIEDTPQGPRDVVVFDTTGLGLLADARVDGSQQELLPKDTQETIMAVVQAKAPVAASIKAGKEADSLDKAKGSLVVSLGRITRLAENRVQVPVARTMLPATNDARVYKLERGKDGWVVAEDSGAIVLQ